MSINIGMTDRIIRAVLGIVILIAPFILNFAIWANPLYKYGAVIIGLILLTTSIVRVCPLYAISGIRTCNTD